MTLSRASCRSAVKELINAGKVKHFGLSETGPQTICGAQVVRPGSVLQAGTPVHF
jgi:aryl-alcohol dehydrogenase-like predicted oxidoreductase